MLISASARPCVRPRCGTITRRTMDGVAVCIPCIIEEHGLVQGDPGATLDECALCRSPIGPWWTEAADEDGRRRLVCGPCARDVRWLSGLRGPGLAAIDRRSMGNDNAYQGLANL